MGVLEVKDVVPGSLLIRNLLFQGHVYRVFGTLGLDVPAFEPGYDLYVDDVVCSLVVAVDKNSVVILYPDMDIARGFAVIRWLEGIHAYFDILPPTGDGGG